VLPARHQRQPGEVGEGQKLAAGDRVTGGGESDDGRGVQPDHLEIAAGRQVSENADVGVVAVQALDDGFGVAGADRYFHARIFLPELAHDVQHVVRRVGNDAQRAGPQRPRFGQQFQRLALGVEHAQRDRQQFFTGRRQRHLLALPVE